SRRRADRGAAPAVRRIARHVGLAAVRGAGVAALEAHVAGADGAAPRDAVVHRHVRQRAGAAAAAVVRVGAGRGLAAVRRIEVAVGEGGLADVDATDAGGTGVGRDVRQRTGRAAATTGDVRVNSGLTAVAN